MTAIKKFIIWIFKIKPCDLTPTYYHCYGFGAHSRIIGDDKSDNPYTYGTPEHDSWNHGWHGLK